ncbi:MAG: hypothetical protein Ta2F_14820 [Termitinemataceae bacterium]|nr:MAG: hypothetical protein Ta2F_14820 [Termitinemataceae bacterium]
MKRSISSFSVISVFVFVAFTSCGKMDVVATDSGRAFGEMIEASNPENIRQDESTGAFAIAAPDEKAAFFWAQDFSKGAGYLGNINNDIALVFDASPFLAAGLDPEKLPDTIKYRNGEISIGSNLGDEKNDAQTIIDGSNASAVAAYKHIVDTSRSRIGYHGSLDHYGITIGEGNLFEWAKTLDTNSKDIVFVLDPAPFIAAGVNPAIVDGWVFAKVIVDDENGKPVEVDKILKPFNLK